MGAPREPTGAPREHQWEHHGGITRAHGSTTGANSGANFSDTGPAGPAPYPNRKIVENPYCYRCWGENQSQVKF